MRFPPFSLAARLCPALLLLTAAPLPADTSVKLGTVSQFSGPGDLDLTGNIEYAINFSPDDPEITVGGVTFKPDNKQIPGVTTLGPQNVPDWQTKPEYGDTADDDALENLMRDIRWANTAGGERLQATMGVTAGIRYKIQVLISANGTESRHWDIRLNGQQAVDEISSLGVSPGESYSQDRSTVWTCEFVPATSPVRVEMGSFFGANDGGDRNPIWQALTLERVYIPPTPDDITLPSTMFFPGQTAPVGEVVVTDGKFGAVHTLTFVSGEGDADNAKFSLVNGALLPAPYDFSAQAPGTVYSVRLRAVDTEDAGRAMEKALTLTLAAPHAPETISLDISSLNGVLPPGQTAGNLLVSDADSFDRHTFSLAAGEGDSQNALFSVEGNRLILLSALPPELAAVSLRLRVTDLSGLWVETVLELPVVEPKVRINEVLAVPTKASRPLDQQSRARDWIELYNEQAQAVNLAGWHLSDDPANPEKWTFPALTIPPKGYLLVFASGTGATPASGPPHLNFSISQDGERLILSRPDGLILDDVETPRSYPNVTWGVGQNGESGYLLTPTPNAPNSAPAAAGSSEVGFSEPHGFKTAAFPLVLTSSLPGAVIRYTLDGTVPRETSPVYTEPLTITPVSGTVKAGTRIVRAIATHPGAPWTPVGTQTYLFVNGVNSPTTDAIRGQTNFISSIKNNTVYSPQLNDAFLSLPAVSLVINGVSTGLPYAETASSIELFDPDGGEPGFTVPAGVLRSGTSSLGYPKGSMSARFRGEYGESSLKYPVYARVPVGAANAATEFQELRLRSCSHDSLSWLGEAGNPSVPWGSPALTRGGDAQFIRNNWVEDMQMIMGQPGKHGRLVNMFVNGNYYGIYHIQEHADDDYMASYFPGDSNDYHFTGGGTTGSSHDNGETWRQPWTKLKASLSNYTQAKRWVDVTNLADYMILMFYIGNDWDWEVLHNWGAAGPSQPDRGGWKFFSQDQDVSLQDVNANCTDQTAPDGVFNSLMAHADFKVLFRDRIHRHLFHEGPLTPAPAADYYKRYADIVYKAVVAETVRWQPSSSVGRLPWDRDGEWTVEKNYLLNTFFPQRTAKLLTQLRARGWYPVNAPEMSQRGGTVDAGTEITLTGPAGASIYYTLDGSDPRLPGGAVSPSAKAFTTALGTRVLAEANDDLPGRGSLWKHLAPAADPGPTWKDAAYDDSGWPSGPVEAGYGDGDEATVVGTADTDPSAPGEQRNLTTYFRRSFSVEDPSSITAMNLRLKRDDGAVVYINGREVFRSGMDAVDVGFNTPGNGGVNVPDDGNTWFAKTLAPADFSLNAGAGNVIAVEVHNATAGSSDISFDLELTATLPVSPEPIILNSAATLRTRARTGTEWSAVNEASFELTGTRPAAANNVTVSEIHYHPQGQDQEDTEFLEFLNTSGSPVNLTGARLEGGITFNFPEGVVLAPGGRAVAVKDMAKFDARYRSPASPWFREGIRVAGSFDGSLSNGGETLLMAAADGAPILTMAWRDDGAWPGRADGAGSSLELVNPAAAPLAFVEKSAWLSLPGTWRPSSEYHGSPGFAGAGPDNRIAINEIYAAPLAAEPAFVELHNPGGDPVDLSGWLLTDAAEVPAKYRLPAGTVVPTGGWYVIPGDLLGSAATLIPFSLNPDGGELSLLQADAGGNPLKFVDRVTYPATPPGTSAGRVPNGTGAVTLLPAATPSAANAAGAAGYDAWAAANFPAGTPPADLALTADPDRDGLSNLLEFATGSSPTLPGPAPLTLTGPPAEFRFRARTSVPGLTMRIEISTDFQTWDASENTVERITQEPNPDGTVTVTARLKDPAPVGRCYARLAVSY